MYSSKVFISCLVIAALSVGCSTLPKGKNVVYYEETQSFPKSTLLVPVITSRTNGISAQGLPIEAISEAIGAVGNATAEIAKSKTEIRTNVGEVRRKLYITGYENDLKDVQPIIEQIPNITDKSIQR